LDISLIKQQLNDLLEIFNVYIVSFIIATKSSGRKNR